MTAYLYVFFSLPACYSQRIFLSGFSSIGQETFGFYWHRNLLFSNAVCCVPCSNEVWDSITLQNGVTCLIVLAIWTASTGAIECHILDIVRVGLGGSGLETAEKVHSILDGFLTPFQEQRLSNGKVLRKAEFLTCCVLDRAYCGRTGNKADLYLSQKLELPKRLGLSDGIHTFNSAGQRAWDTRKEEDASSTTSSSTDSSTKSNSDSEDAEELGARSMFPALSRWTWACKAFKSKFRRGIFRDVLSTSFTEHGQKAETQILGPSATRFFTHSTDFLQQSVTQFAVRYDALVAALKLPAKRQDQRKKLAFLRKIFAEMMLGLIMFLFLLQAWMASFKRSKRLLVKRCSSSHISHIHLLTAGHLQDRCQIFVNGVGIAPGAESTAWLCAWVPAGAKNFGPFLRNAFGNSQD